MVDLIFLIPAIPLAASAFLLLLGRRFKNAAGWIATLSMVGAFSVSIMALGELLQRVPAKRKLTQDLFDWVSVGDLHVPMSFRIDQLSVVMLLVVTGVGALIHLYSIGYMEADPRRSTFFGYLNLFASSMLILVLANNFLVMFLGWELVGLCSYLLISFWHDRPSAAAAGKKAFIVNRIGDLGFLIAMFLIYREFGSLDMDTVFSLGAAQPGSTAIKAICLLLLLGATGKSAQIPLYVWLPDAMEGPTPVSALIHAATMVTAGVYMVARAHVLFEGAPLAASLVTAIGIATALLAALIALTQDDIKRVLAYSTISQLGYMFVAVGIGALTGSPLAYVAGIFHLVTHAFFKALLFLGSGSVMHALGDETDMKKMGGLLKSLPITGTTFIIGWLAISGVPPFAGFFSKEAILSEAYSNGLKGVWLVGLIVAAITAFYMSRQVFLTFFGKSRVSEDVHPHESPETMTIVLQALAFLAAAGGLINLTLHSGKLTKFLSPVFAGGGHEALHVEVLTPFGLPEIVISAFVASLSLASIFLAYRLYLAEGAEARRERVKGGLGPIVSAARAKFYVDEIYGAVFVKPGRKAADLAAYQIDARLIDGSVNGIGALVIAGAGKIRHIQSGQVRRYIMAMFGGAVLILAFFLTKIR
ncbi:MAG TPA: NADH-quinone oxidoreductase subunit L [Actinomycetota bacterium]|nr:NADH-quinone oxidoreductase subunit L [Actinomycetota bacterium]